MSIAILVGAKDLSSVRQPNTYAHDMIKINLLDYINYFGMQKMKYPKLFDIFTSCDFIRIGLVGSYSYTSIFVGDIPEGKIRYGIGLKSFNNVKWSRNLRDFSYYIKNDWVE